MLTELKKMIRKLSPEPQKTLDEGMHQNSSSTGKSQETQTSQAQQKAPKAPVTGSRGSRLVSREGLGQVSNVIAVASGKGGVGKSTTTVNLAYALAKRGAKVGILDADLYGPSIPMMVRKTSPVIFPENQDQTKQRVIIPPTHAGVKIISIGLFNDVDQAAIMRGPMASSVIKQFISSVRWGKLDYLLIDYPPGTGDIQLTLAQSSLLTGALLVTTPQDIALLDVQKALNMFEVTRIPVLGIIENMSYFICDGCDKRHSLFRENGGKKLSKKKGIPLVGEIPFEPAVVASGDSGIPSRMAHPDSASAKAYDETAHRLSQGVASVSRSNIDGALSSFKIKWQSPKKASSPMESEGRSASL